MQYQCKISEPDRDHCEELIQLTLDYLELCRSKEPLIPRLEWFTSSVDAQ